MNTTVLRCPSAAWTPQQPSTRFPSPQARGGFTHNPYRVPAEGWVQPREESSGALAPFPLLLTEASHYKPRQRLSATALHLGRLALMQPRDAPPTPNPTADVAAHSALAPQSPRRAVFVPEYAEKSAADVRDVVDEGCGEISGVELPPGLPSQLPSEVELSGEVFAPTFPPQGTGCHDHTSAPSPPLVWAPPTPSQIVVAGIPSGFVDQRLIHAQLHNPYLMSLPVSKGLTSVAVHPMLSCPALPPQGCQGPSYAAEMPENCPMLWPVPGLAHAVLTPRLSFPARGAALRRPTRLDRAVEGAASRQIRALVETGLALGNLSLDEQLHRQRLLLPHLQGDDRPRKLTERGDLVHFLRAVGYRVVYMISRLSETPKTFQDENHKEIFWAVDALLQETLQVTAEHILKRSPRTFGKLGLRQAPGVAKFLKSNFPAAFAVEYLVQRGRQ